MSLLQSLIKFRIHLPGISLTLHARLNSYGPTDRFCIGAFVVPIVGRLRRPFVCAFSPRLGFASWRSLNYFAVARHLWSKFCNLYSDDESFRFVFDCVIFPGVYAYGSGPRLPMDLPFRFLFFDPAMTFFQGHSLQSAFFAGVFPGTGRLRHPVPRLSISIAFQAFKYCGDVSIAGEGYWWLFGEGIEGVDFEFHAVGDEL